MLVTTQIIVKDVLPEWPFPILAEIRLTLMTFAMLIMFNLFT